MAHVIDFDEYRVRQEVERGNKEAAESEMQDAEIIMEQLITKGIVR